jgi:hypothetical protein
LNVGGLDEIERFRLGGDVLECTIGWLQEVGRQGNEGFVLWSGVRDGTTFSIRRALWPRQEAHKTDAGLLVYVSGDALHEVNKFCFEHDEIVGAQVHTHPTDAYHSETDDHHPLVTLRGSLSVVIPGFAVAGWGSVDRWAWYRLVGDATWRPVDRAIVEVVW